MGGMRGRGVCVAGGGSMHGRGCVGGMCGRGACVAGGVHTMHAPPQTPRDTVGQCAGNTHPIGMHSCFKYNDKS